MEDTAVCTVEGTVADMVDTAEDTASGVYILVDTSAAGVAVESAELVAEHNPGSGETSGVFAEVQSAVFSPVRCSSSP